MRRRKTRRKSLHACETFPTSPFFTSSLIRSNFMSTFFTPNPPPDTLQIVNLLHSADHLVIALNSFIHSYKTSSSTWWGRSVCRMKNEFMNFQTWRPILWLNKIRRNFSPSDFLYHPFLSCILLLTHTISRSHLRQRKLGVARLWKQKRFQ